MDPCVVPDMSNLHDYIAVPGKIIPIPGTDYVVITPDTSKMQDNSNMIVPDEVQVDKEDAAVIAAAREAEADDGDIAVAMEEEMAEEGEEQLEQEKEVLPLLPPSITCQLRKRGRPLGKSKPCECPNCQVSNCCHLSLYLFVIILGVP